MKIIASFLGVIIAVSVGFYNAWVAWLIWSWHVAPAFSWPDLHYWQVVGIITLFSWARPEPHQERGETFTKRMLIREIVFPAGLLGIAFLAKVMEVR